MDQFDYNILQCPVTKEGLKILSKAEADKIIKQNDYSFLAIENITAGFINESHSYFYPVFDDIIILLPTYALFLGSGEDKRGKMVFDKKRVFDYYNEINYSTKNSFQIYEDSPKWVDFREVSKDYILNSFTKAKRYLNESGKYFLDIASGPIGLPEYIELSEKFEIRICIDISIKALIQAKYNYKHKKGIFICGDITNIPIERKSLRCGAISAYTISYSER